MPRNYYLNVNNFQVGPPSTLLPGQGNVTQAQFEAIVLSQVKELWTRYGQLQELWFDGGYGGTLGPQIKALLQQTQPEAACFNGDGITANAVRWVGTESGMPKGPLWETGCSNAGDPNSTQWCPPGCDTTLQLGDTWFWTGIGIRDLATLITVYHDTVGAGGTLELDFAIDRDGLVDPAHAARYKQFGAWIRSCYGAPLAHAAANGTAPIVLSLPGGAAGSKVDRVWTRELIEVGQRVRSYVVEYMAAGSSTWAPFASGTAIGNKRIDLHAGGSVTATQLRLTVTSSVAEPAIMDFAAFAPCPSS